MNDELYDKIMALLKDEERHHLVFLDDKDGSFGTFMNCDNYDLYDYFTALCEHDVQIVDVMSNVLMEYRRKHSIPLFANNTIN